MHTEMNDTTNAGSPKGSRMETNDQQDGSTRMGGISGNTGGVTKTGRGRNEPAYSTSLNSDSPELTDW